MQPMATLISGRQAITTTVPPLLYDGLMQYRMELLENLLDGNGKA